MKKSGPKVIVIGDSFNNTLGLIRSLGQAGAYIVLLLIGIDRLFVRKSRFVKEYVCLQSLSACEDFLKEGSRKNKGAFLICSNDKAAKWIDDNEYWLSKYYITPMRGRKLGELFDKPNQCKLATDFGIRIPTSKIYIKNEPFPESIEYPILLKPANSNKGEKSDIHICRNHNELGIALSQNTSCNIFIVQEYIEKDFEINLIGISTIHGVIIPGGIMKIRHYPTIYSPCSFGRFLSVEELAVDTEQIKKLIHHIGYRGPFSIEFLKKDDKLYFMEVNFRHDGLAYTATAAGINLLDLYINDVTRHDKIKPIYMMDLSIDFCHVKNKNISLTKWIVDFWNTRCQLNFNRKDPIPTVYYYLSKFGIIKN